MQLIDKVAIVTGAARGLGRAYAEAIAAKCHTSPVGLIQPYVDLQWLSVD